MLYDPCSTFCSSRPSLHTTANVARRSTAQLDSTVHSNTPRVQRVCTTLHTCLPHLTSPRTAPSHTHSHTVTRHLALCSFLIPPTTRSLHSLNSHTPRPHLHIPLPPHFSLVTPYLSSTSQLSTPPLLYLASLSFPSVRHESPPLLKFAAVSAALCFVLSAPAARAQLSTCTALVGDANLADYPGSQEAGGSNAIQAIGFFTAPNNMPTYNQYIFQYTVPDQTGYETPNHLKFALYTNDPSNPALVAESNMVTIKNVGGDQSLVATVANQVSQIQAGQSYLLGHSQRTHSQIVSASHSAATMTAVAAVSHVTCCSSLTACALSLLSCVERVRLCRVREPGRRAAEEVTYPYDATTGFPDPLPITYDSLYNYQFPVTYSGCTGQVVGDPVFTGFNGERFLVKGLPDRVYNILSLPTLQLNTRFIPITAGQSMNSTQQSNIRHRQSKLIAALKTKSGESEQRLPSTTSWSHDGLYMGETGVQMAGHKLLIKPGAYVSGFAAVELDGAELPVSSQPVQLLDGSTILRSSSSVVEFANEQVMFTLVNSRPLPQHPLRPAARAAVGDRARGWPAGTVRVTQLPRREDRSLQAAPGGGLRARGG